MDIERKIESIKIRKNKDICIFMIHGYTGSPTDFGELPSLLLNHFNADIVCPLLPGHGTRIEDIYDKKLEDYIFFIEKEFKKEIQGRKKIILIGISFGAQLALYLSERYEVDCLVLASETHYLKPLSKIPFLEYLFFFTKALPKNYHPAEIELRKNAFSYKFMPIISLGISKKLSKIVEKDLHKIRCSCLFVHGRKDGLGDVRKIPAILRKISSTVKKVKIFDVKNHNLFYSKCRNMVSTEVINFIKRGIIDDPIERATAIVPAYNEEKRIYNVLNCLTKTKYINEIIVVDDGSEDKTSDIVKKFKKIKYVKNKKNMGKGESMNMGVKLAKNDVVFFCDADLVNFKPEYADQITLPVIQKQTEMFIGMRGNIMQRGVKSWGLNSGERALRKNVWNNLPKFYKYRYRIEAGLNYYVKHYLGGFDWKMFDYSQPIKEKKYGILKGTLLRWWMNFDVLRSYFSFPFIYKNKMVPKVLNKKV